MELSPLALVGIGLATMFFGYAFGLFEGRSQGRKQHAKDMAALKPEPPAPAQPPPPPIPTPRESSLLRLSLDKSQRPRLELDDRAVDTANMSPDQRKRLIDLMVTMRPWIETAPSRSPASTPQTDSFPAQPASAPAGGSVPPATSPRPAADPGAPTTMVGQIDAILQSRLAGTPLASRGIRIAESGEGGATIHVGLDTYPGVGEVPDKEVQAAIRAAITEWEAKYTPG